MERAYAPAFNAGYRLPTPCGCGPTNTSCCGTVASQRVYLGPLGNYNDSCCNNPYTDLDDLWICQGGGYGGCNCGNKCYLYGLDNSCQCGNYSPGTVHSNYNNGYPYCDQNCICPARCGWSCGPIMYSQPSITRCQTNCTLGCCGATGSACKSVCEGPLYSAMAPGYVAPCGLPNYSGGATCCGDCNANMYTSPCGGKC
eukprot:g3748.t1